MDLLSFHPPPPPPRLATPAVVSTFPLLLLPASEPSLAAPHILQPVDIDQRQISERRWLELSPSPGSTSSTAASASAGRQPSYASVTASPPPSLPQPPLLQRRSRARSCSHAHARSRAQPEGWIQAGSRRRYRQPPWSTPTCRPVLPPHHP
jgi:hypothetical protein